ncbi:hypothetical protein EAI30_02975 [Romboutsia ilealis]|uniref:YitT family protein n=1 Tax=Romboutsia faecis TaxID=2764597 RepID=A0ABR7JQV6_9FIRM|nr:DUF6198 family protein [Romboutsia faecis]MBC5997290.1 hypothetical protein [Romboutsia faecis]MRN23572.1 hypothetical protein [Romboutsia ilealis]
MKNKKLFIGELALLMGLIINSFANTLMVKSGFGISSISSVPYTLSLVFDKITYGSWNYIFQCALIFILVLITKKFKVGYIVSFFLAIVFGNMIDFCNIFIMQKLPNNIIYNIIYFLISFSMLSVGMSLLLKCKTPVLPIDTFTRDLTEEFDINYKKVKTVFDLSCLATTIIFSVVFLKGFEGIGIGTVICALITGKVVSFVNSFVDEHFYFKPMLSKKSNKEINEDNIAEEIN